MGIKKALTAKVIDGLEVVKTKTNVDSAEVKVSEEMSDTKRMIELLEAIDWKLWMMFKKINEDDDE
jgi:ribosomal protein L4